MTERVQSVDRVFGLLEHLADGDGSLTLSELAARSALPMPTIHRLIRFLVSQGYVRQDPAKRYTIGPRMIWLGEAASRMLGSWATPVLTRLVDEFGETTNMAMLEGDGVIYVAQVPSPRAMRMFTEVGRFVMPHCTGVGKAIMSTMSDDEVTALLQRTGMPARTEHTITDIDAMLAELADDPRGRLRRRRRRAGARGALRRRRRSRTCPSGRPSRSPVRTAGSRPTRSGRSLRPPAGPRPS